MKCLEKDRNRRYETASALAVDLQRYLRDEAVDACPPSAPYRLRKFARRNWRVLMTAGFVALALVAATVVSTWQALQARDAQHQAEVERDRAETAQKQAEVAEGRAVTEAAIASAVSRFIKEDLIEQAGSAPEAAQALTRDPNLTVREALHRAAAKIGQRFQNQPLVESAIRTVIGDTYNSLGDNQLAVPHLERALALLKLHLGPDHPDTLGSMYGFAIACEWTGRVPEAIALHQQMLENKKVLLGQDHPQTLACVRNLAIAYRKAGQWGTSVPLLDQLLEKQRTILGPTHPDTLRTMVTLAMNYEDLGRFTEAFALHEKLMETRKSQTITDPLWLDAYARACQRAGKLDQAGRLLRESLENRRKRDDTRGRIMTAFSLDLLGLNLLMQKEYKASEPLVREALTIHENDRPDDWRRFHLMSVLGDVLSGQQKYAEAEPFLLQGYEGLKQREAIIVAPWRYRLTEAGERIVRFYEVTKQPEKNRLWRSKLSAVAVPSN